MATPFKMKSSPTKGKLGDFFQNITKKATPETKAKRVEAKSTRKAGESQYKADVRTRREANRASKKTVATNKADAAYYRSVADIAKNSDANKKKKVVKKEVVKKVPKVTGALGSKTRKEQYDAKGWKYDETIKGYNKDGSKKVKTTKVKVKKGGSNDINQDGIDDNTQGLTKNR